MYNVLYKQAFDFLPSPVGESGKFPPRMEIGKFYLMRLRFRNITINESNYLFSKILYIYIGVNIDTEPSSAGQNNNRF